MMAGSRQIGASAMTHLRHFALAHRRRAAHTRCEEARMPIEGQQLKPVLERLTAPSFAIDIRGKVRWQNDAAVDLLGDIRGRPFTAAVAPHDISRLRRQFARKIVDGNASDFEATLITKSGGVASCGLSSTALHRDGLIVGVFGVITRQPRGEYPRPVGADRLTARQFEVLQLVAGGATTEEIAEVLHLSRETVRNHVHAVLRRLGARNRLEAVMIARRDALVLQ
jgi:DNA-binding CsgD family transcriptional regulator